MKEREPALINDSNKSKATALGSVIALRGEEELFHRARSVLPLVIQLRTWGQDHRATHGALLVHTEYTPLLFQAIQGNSDVQNTAVHHRVSGCQFCREGWYCLLDGEWTENSAIRSGL